MEHSVVVVVVAAVVAVGGLVLAAVRVLRWRFVSRRVRPWKWWSLTAAGGVPEPETMRANAVVAMQTLRCPGAVVVCRSERGTATFVGFPGDVPAAAVEAFGRAAGSSVAPLNDPVALAAVAVCEAVVPSGDPHSGGSSNLGDVSTVAKSLSSFLPVGGWVAVGFRSPSRGENRHVSSWYRVHPATSANARTHPALAEGAVVLSMWSGADDVSQAGPVLSAVAGGLHGFDVRVEPRSVSGLDGVPLTVALLLVPVAGTVAGLAAGWSVWASACLAAVGMAAPVVASRGWAASKSMLIREGFAQGSVPVPRRRRWPVRQRPELRDASGAVTSVGANPYPLASSSFPAGAQHPLMVAVPFAQTATAAATTARRQTPAALSDPVGARLGVGDGDDKAVHVSCADRFGGLMFFGVPGSGKTTIVHNVWLDDLVRRVRPTGIPGDVGRNNTMIAWEFKSGRKGVRDWLRYAAELGCGDDVVFVDIHDPSTPRIDLFGGGDPVEVASRFAEAWESAIEADSSGRAGGGVLLGPAMTMVFALALSVTPEIAADAGFPFGSPMFFASVLAGIGTESDNGALRLYAALRTAAEYAEREAGTTAALFTAATPMATGVGRAVTLGVNHFQNLKPSARTDAMAPFARRLAALSSADAWFRRDRPQVSWRELIQRHKVVVINVGPPAREGVPALGRPTDDLAALLFETMRAEIDLSCQGWQDAGRAVTVYVEELSMAARRSAAAVQWLRNQGRFAGVRLVLATQDFDSLPDEVFGLVAGFSTLGFFSLGDDPRIRDWALRYLSGTEPGVWEQQLPLLPPHRCILSTKVNGVPQPRVVVRPDFWAETSGVELRARFGL